MEELTWGKRIDKHFAEEGVWVTVPPQNSGYELAIRKKRMPPRAEMPEDPTEFAPKIFVINFEVLQRENDGAPISIVEKFSPRMKLKVTRRDNYRKLACLLGRRWDVFTEKDHDFRLTPNSGIAFIRDWGDPPVAWG